MEPNDVVAELSAPFVDFAHDRRFVEHMTLIDKFDTIDGYLLVDLIQTFVGCTRTVAQSLINKRVKEIPSLYNICYKYKNRWVIPSSHVYSLWIVFCQIDSLSKEHPYYLLFIDDDSNRFIRTCQLIPGTTNSSIVYSITRMITTSIREARVNILQTLLGVYHQSFLEARYQFKNWFEVALTTRRQVQQVHDIHESICSKLFNWLIREHNETLKNATRETKRHFSCILTTCIQYIIESNTSNLILDGIISIARKYGIKLKIDPAFILNNVVSSKSYDKYEILLNCGIIKHNLHSQTPNFIDEYIGYKKSFISNTITNLIKTTVIGDIVASY